MPLSLNPHFVITVNIICITFA